MILHIVDGEFIHEAQRAETVGDVEVAAAGGTVGVFHHTRNLVEVDAETETELVATAFEIYVMTLVEPVTQRLGKPIGVDSSLDVGKETVVTHHQSLLRIRVGMLEVAGETFKLELLGCVHKIIIGEVSPRALECTIVTHLETTHFGCFRLDHNYTVGCL